MSRRTVEDDHEFQGARSSCLACGGQIEAPLSFTASLRCAQCRDDNAPLNEVLVADWRVAVAAL